MALLCKGIIIKLWSSKCSSVCENEATKLYQIKFLPKTEPDNRSVRIHVTLRLRFESLQKGLQAKSNESNKLRNMHVAYPCMHTTTVTLRASAIWRHGWRRWRHELNECDCFSQKSRRRTGTLSDSKSSKPSTTSRWVASTHVPRFSARLLSCLLVTADPCSSCLDAWQWLQWSRYDHVQD